MRERTFCPNQNQQGSPVWTNSDTGERTASMGVHADWTRATGGCASLTRAPLPGRARNAKRTAGSNWRPRRSLQAAGAGGSSAHDRPACDQPVPALGHPAVLIPACVPARPSSQRESPRGRALHRAFKLRRKLRSNGGIGERIRKPRHAPSSFRMQDGQGGDCRNPRQQPYGFPRSAPDKAVGNPRERG